MYSLIAESAAKGGLHLADIPVPRPGATEALVEVAFSSVNPTDLHRARNAPVGTMLGYAAAGTVVSAAEDGSGPAVGTRVAGLGLRGTWGEIAAIPTQQLAVVPDGVGLDAAATMPLAGVSALRALRALGPILGRRVLITGATGAVGTFAVQLAAMAGTADVIALARNTAAFAHLRELGARVVVDGLTPELGLVDGVVDNVGGTALTLAFAQTAAGGTVVSVGRASGDDVVLAPSDLMGDWGRSGRTIRTFFMPEEGTELGDDISFLLRLADEGRVRSVIDHRVDLRGDLGPLRHNEGRGKGVLRMHPH